MLRLNPVKIICHKCFSEFTLYENDFECDSYDDERQMGAQIGYTWAYSGECPDCGTEGSVEISAWEYPIGVHNYEETEISEDFSFNSPGDYAEVVYEDDTEMEGYDIDDSKVNAVTHIPSATTQVNYCCFHFGATPSSSSPASTIQPAQKQPSSQLDLMQDFLNTHINDIFENFKKLIATSDSTKCDLDISFVQGAPNEIDYDNEIHQYFYLLKYFYAYFIEYWHIYKKVDLEKLSIFSIGCGTTIDMYGAYFAKDRNSNSIKYFGIDPSVWHCRDLIPKVTQKCIKKQTLKECLETFKKEGLNKTLGLFNVIIFPKSIEYLSAEEIDLFKDCIQETSFKEREIYLILNGMDRNFEDDMQVLNQFVSAFEKKGFTKEIVDGVEKLPPSFYKLSDGLMYPAMVKKCLNKSHICLLCSNSGKGTFCQNVKDKWLPICKTSSFNYTIVKLKI